WKKDTSKIKDFNLLPEKTKAYLKRIEELSGVEIKIVSVGPEREATIIKGDLF
ncbi:MAG: adenylosuccinate synthase, partial [Desulfobacteraceae bacterium]|nr:adenylosuccinate synthase [Desulfobacteraceae bacterium]